jgi:hypothetical protein
MFRNYCDRLNVMCGSEETNKAIYNQSTWDLWLVGAYSKTTDFLGDLQICVPFNLSFRPSALLQLISPISLL